MWRKGRRRTSARSPSPAPKRWSCSEHDLLVNGGSGWQVQPEVHALLQSLPNLPQLNVVAGLPNGGAVLAGHDVVIERDSAAAPWHFSEQPIVDETAVAASADSWKARKCARCCRSCPTSSTRRRSCCRRSNPTTAAVIPPNPLPGDGYLLRETPGGWEDEERAAYAGDSRGQAGQDRPDPRARPRLRRRGLGGRRLERRGRRRWARHDRQGPGQTIRENVQTAGIYSYASRAIRRARRGGRRTRTAESGVATFAVAGHAECAEPCASLADEGIAPDRNLGAALGEIAGLAAQPNGPRMLLYTGGRETPGRGFGVSRRGRPLRATARPGRGPGVLPSRLGGRQRRQRSAAFRAAFAGFNAPFGEGGHRRAQHREHSRRRAGAVSPGRAPTTRLTAPAPPAPCG